MSDSRSPIPTSPHNPKQACNQTTTPPIPIERIEMVTGYQEPSEPMWRIVLNGYCADFPSEQAARNFADQIASVKEPA